MDKSIKAAVTVAALGYFVDVYDLILFSVVRISSLTSLGLTPEEITNEGVYLINMQMTGMLLGGILWGILGDKRGRVSVLFGSIFVYSVANIANAYVDTVSGYAFWRFIAGLGLAGELGAGITLVAELMPREKRGYGTTIVASVGVSGAIFAAVTASYFDWRTNYLIGGFLGLMLFVLRIAVTESGMFKSISERRVERGNLLLLFATKARIAKFFSCILCGLPIWCVVGILATFSPEIGRELNITGEVSPAKAVLFTYVGLFIGDMSSGLISQFIRSRKKVLYLFIAGTLLCSLIILNANRFSPEAFYWLYLPVGIFIGYWAMFVTVAAEQFGTNLRATVTTSVPNFVRGAVVAITSMFQFLMPHSGAIGAALTVVLLTVALALLGVARLSESFSNDLDYIEQ